MEGREGTTLALEEWNTVYSEHSSLVLAQTFTVFFNSIHYNAKLSAVS